MKSKLLSLLLVLVMLVGCMSVLTACGGEDEPPHEHVYDQKITNNTYLKSAATTEAKAVYYYSCSCGEKGTETFEYGNKLTDTGKVDDPGIVDYPWEMTDVIFQVNPNDNGGNLSSGTERYLDGSDAADPTGQYMSNIDDLIDQRNDNAKTTTKVNVTFSYINASKYGWGAAIQYLFETTDGDGAPDFYIFFIYDLVSASLKGAFANLFSQVRGTNYFAFAEYGDDYEEDGTGYMYYYMRSLTLSKYKMYVLASDYFTDLIRSFFVVPVNADLLKEIQVDQATLGNYANGGELVYNSDRTGDGQFDMADLYQLVYDMDWDYSALIQFSNAIKQESGKSTGWDIADKLGFAMDTTSGLPASGLVYTTSVVVIDREWDADYWCTPDCDHDADYAAHGDYIYSYPTTNSDLTELFTNIATLMSSQGVAVVNKNDGSDKSLVSAVESSGSGTKAIRARFVEDQILFGGIVNVGSIEDVDTYQSMTNGMEIGFGVVPVPLYKSYEDYVEDNQADLCKYQTQIHNNARAGAIGVKTTHFSELSAYLDYQSRNSTNILEEYYTVELMIYATGGDTATGDMLAYIRKNVRSSFDKAFEDAIGKAFSEAKDKDAEDNSEKQKWHAMLKDNDFLLGENIDSFYESVRETKEKYLQSLYNGYGMIGESGGLPN